MPNKKLDASEWKDFFDRVSRELTAKQMELEVAGLDLGDEVEAEWIPFTGISYDPKDDVLSVFSEEIEHMIRHPKEIWVDYGVDGLHAVEVIDPDGHKQIVTLKDDLALPEPDA